MKVISFIEQPFVIRRILKHLDLWFEKIVKTHYRGEATIIRYADDGVCAFQYQGDAERFYKVLPKRLSKFGLEVAPDKTRLLRFSQYHVGLQRRFTFLGFEFYWKEFFRGLNRRLRRRACGDRSYCSITWNGIIF